jgi:hypothetical protein
MSDYVISIEPGGWRSSDWQQNRSAFAKKATCESSGTITLRVVPDCQTYRRGALQAPALTRLGLILLELSECIFQMIRLVRIVG